MARLARVSLECRPALEIIRAYGAEPRALLYVDPPYLGSTRALNYQCEMPSDAEHEALAEALAGAVAAVVVSGYRSPLYERLYAGWTAQPRYAAFNGNGTDRTRTEVLWSNRPFPQGSLFDHLEDAATRRRCGMIFRRPRPEYPPVPPDDRGRTGLAAALLFTTTPTDRALAGWSAAEWAALELEELGVISPATTEGAA